MTYEQPIFNLGGRYRVKKSFKSGPIFTFILGEILVFDRNSYSHYDNSFVYVFRAESDGKEKEWWLSEHDKKDVWKQHFEELAR